MSAFDYGDMIEKENLDNTIVYMAKPFSDQKLQHSEIAFPEDRKGVIRISHKCTDGGECILEVADNGVGMEKSDKTVTDKSMGMFLVSALTEELEGELTIKTKNGVSSPIRFKVGKTIS